MINDPFHPEEALEREKETTRSRLFGVVCAVAITALLLVGYAFIKRFYSQRRKSDRAEEKLVVVEPGKLQPLEEGTYSLTLPASDYGSITLVGLRADPEAKLVAFTTAPGKVRAPERLEPRTIIVKRPGRER